MLGCKSIMESEYIPAIVSPNNGKVISQNNFGFWFLRIVRDKSQMCSIWLSENGKMMGKHLESFEKNDKGILDETLISILSS